MPLRLHRPKLRLPTRLLLPKPVSQQRHMHLPASLMQLPMQLPNRLPRHPLRDRHGPMSLQPMQQRLLLARHQPVRLLLHMQPGLHRALMQPSDQPVHRRHMQKQRPMRRQRAQLQLRLLARLHRLRLRLRHQPMLLEPMPERRHLQQHGRQLLQLHMSARLHWRSM
jgi:hypothetical protein